ncbi:MAG: ankyrin repeat domain-containing protein [Gammaproteobacteria bacterium]|nr:ankyrin repeat domain-containing protein [Gammaproteobacteria bacterium]
MPSVFLEVRNLLSQRFNPSPEEAHFSEKKRVEALAIKIKRLIEAKFRELKVEFSDESLLCSAARFGFDEIVQYLIEKGVALDVTVCLPGHRDHGKTALRLAYERGYYQMVMVLLDAGAQDIPINNIFTRGSWVIELSDDYLIHRATRDAQLPIVKRLLEGNAALLEQKNKDGETPLVIAARYQFVLGVRYFISLNANLNVVTTSPENRGKTALHWAYQPSQYKVIEILMEAGAVDTPVDGEYVFHKIIRSGQLGMAELFLSKQPGLLQQKDGNNKRPIQLASDKGWSNLSLYFHQQYAQFHNTKERFVEIPDTVDDAHVVSSKGQNLTSPEQARLIRIAISGDIWAAQELRMAADVNFKQFYDNPGRLDHRTTPAELAYQKGHYITMCFLLEAGGAGNILVTEDLIDKVAQYGTLKTVERLLDKRSDLMSTSLAYTLFNREEFREPSDRSMVAARNGYSHIVRYLIQNNLFFNTPFNPPAPFDFPRHKYHGKTPLGFAYDAGHHETVEILIQAGFTETNASHSNTEHLIHKVAKDGLLRMIQLLTQRDPNLFTRLDAKNRTALWWAVHKGHQKLIKFLDDGTAHQASLSCILINHSIWRFSGSEQAEELAVAGPVCSESAKKQAGL